MEHKSQTLQLQDKTLRISHDPSLTFQSTVKSVHDTYELSNQLPNRSSKAAANYRTRELRCNKHINYTSYPTKQ